MELLAINEIKLHEQFDNFASLDELSIKEQAIHRTLGDSLVNIGLVNPLLVQKKNNEIYLIDGYKRLRIIKELFKLEKSIPLVQDNKVQVEFISANIEADVARFMCSAREGMKFTETARNMEDLLKKFHVSRSELAHKTGQKEYMLSRFSRYDRIITAVGKDIDNGKLPITATKYFILLTPEGQKILHKQLKKIRSVNKILIEKLAYKMPEKYFIKTKEERNKISSIGIGHKPKKHIFDSQMEKNILNEQLSDRVAELNILYKERERYVINLEKLVAMFDLALRYTDVKEYIRKHHPNIFDGVTTIIKQELNKEIK